VAFHSAIYLVITHFKMATIKAGIERKEELERIELDECFT
jgi:hypothetical protein